MLDGKADLGDLDDYATEEWVVGQDYVTLSVLLDELATLINYHAPRSWVEENYVSNAWLGEQGYVTASDLNSMLPGTLVYFGGSINVANEEDKSPRAIVGRATRAAEYVIWNPGQLTDLPDPALPWATVGGTLWLKIEASGGVANTNKKATITDSNNQTATRILVDGAWTGPWSLLSNVGTSNYLHMPQTIPSGTSLNYFTTAGMYSVTLNSVAQTIANIPEPVSGSLLVEKHVGTKQTYTTYVPGNPRTYVRSFDGTSWGPWIEMISNGSNLVFGADRDFTIEVVPSMPASPAANTIYLVTGN